MAVSQSQFDIIVYHCLRHNSLILLASAAVTFLHCWILAFLDGWQLRKQTVQLVGN